MSKPNGKRNRKIQRRGGDFDGAISPRSLKKFPGYSEPWYHDEDPLIERELAEEKRQWELRNKRIEEQRKRLKDARNQSKGRGTDAWRLCPCGCGGELAEAEAHYLRTLDDRIEILSRFNSSGIPKGQDLIDGQVLVDEGRQFRAAIIAVFHGADRHLVDRDRLKGWIALSNRLKKDAKRALKDAGQA